MKENKSLLLIFESVNTGDIDVASSVRTATSFSRNRFSILTSYERMETAVNIVDTNVIKKSRDSWPPEIAFWLLGRNADSVGSSFRRFDAKLISQWPWIETD